MLNFFSSDLYNLDCWLPNGVTHEEIGETLVYTFLGQKKITFFEHCSIDFLNSGTDLKVIDCYMQLNCSRRHQSYRRRPDDERRRNDGCSVVQAFACQEKEYLLVHHCPLSQTVCLQKEGLGTQAKAQT